MVVSDFTCPANIIASCRGIPRFNAFVRAVLRNRCGCAFSTPAFSPIRRMIYSIPVFVSRLFGFLLPTNSAGSLSFLLSRYSFRYMLVRSLMYTVLSFAPFPYTISSLFAYRISSLLISESSDTLTAVLYRNSSNALSRRLLHLRSIRSRSSSVYGFRIFFSTFIDSTSNHRISPNPVTISQPSEEAAIHCPDIL